MLYLAEARAMTRKARFANSGWAKIVDSAIREACERGEDSAIILLPQNVVEDMVTLLCDHGFKAVVTTGVIAGAMVSVAW